MRRKTLLNQSINQQMLVYNIFLCNYLLYLVSFRKLMIDTIDSTRELLLKPKVLMCMYICEMSTCCVFEETLTEQPAIKIYNINMNQQIKFLWCTIYSVVGYIFKMTSIQSLLVITLWFCGIYIVPPYQLWDC